VEKWHLEEYVKHAKNILQAYLHVLLAAQEFVLCVLFLELDFAKFAKERKR
jgi:hypothetical protein